MPNRYQLRKARLIAASLLLAACASDTPLATLPMLLARADESQWVSLSIAAGVPVADAPCRAAVLAILAELAA